MMTDYVNLDNQCLAESQASNEGILQALAACNGPQDTAYFAQLVKKPWSEPSDFMFEPCAEADRVPGLCYRFGFFVLTHPLLISPRSPRKLVMFT